MFKMSVCVSVCVSVCLCVCVSVCVCVRVLDRASQPPSDKWGRLTKNLKIPAEGDDPYTPLNHGYRFQKFEFLGEIFQWNLEFKLFVSSLTKLTRNWWSGRAWYLWYTDHQRSLFSLHFSTDLIRYSNE